MYNADYTRQYTNTRRQTGDTFDKVEPNIHAAKALCRALGLSSRRKPYNWTVCHIWGIDDHTFQASNTIVQNPRYYSCVANMVLLPSPLKALTDAMPEIKLMLRVCAYHLYGWACEDKTVIKEAEKIKNGFIPPNYPESWPTINRPVLPKNVAPFSQEVQKFIEQRKAKIKQLLESDGHPLFPRRQVRDVLNFWNIPL